jgi:hypothetical protein
MYPDGRRELTMMVIDVRAGISRVPQGILRMQEGL